MMKAPLLPRLTPQALIAFAIWTFATLAFADSSQVPTATTSGKGGLSVSTIYYAPVTITPSANCLAKTSFSYITMRALTGSSLGALTSSLSTVTPWSVATIAGAIPTTASAVAGLSYVQIDVFLSQAPFSLGPNGEESAWAKACYDPRNTLCPSNNVYGPNEAGISCITGFPGAGVAATTQQTTAVETVFGPYKNGAGGSSMVRTVEAQGRLLWEVMVVVVLVAGLGYL